MNILGRKLLLISLGFTLGVFFYQYSLFLSLILIPLSFLSLIFLGKKGIVIIVSAIFFLTGGAYTHLSEKINIKKAYPYTESEQTVKGTVITIPEVESYGQSALVLSDGVKIHLMTRDAVLNYKDEISFKGTFKFPDEKSRPFAFDYKTNLKSEGAYLTVFATDINKEGNSLSLFNPVDAITLLRLKALNIADGLWQGEQLMFARAILFGDNSYSSSIFRDKLSEGSISHIIAVSGTHVSLVFLLFMLLVKNFSIRNKKLYFAVLPVILFFVLFTGASPSAIRAAIMLTLFIVAAATLSHYDAPTALAVASFSLLITNPFIAFSLSYIFSFSAVSGILLFTKPFENALSFIPLKWLRTSLSVTLAAQIFTAPSLAFVFGRIPFLSLLANLLLIPLIPVIMASGYLAVTFSFIPDIFNFFAFLFDFLSSVCIKVAEIAAKIPFSNIYPVFQNVFLFILCFVMMISFFLFFFVFRKRKIGVIILSVTILCFTLNHYYPSVNGENAVYFLDSEHGDCTVVLSEAKISVVDCSSPDTRFIKYTLLPFMRQKGFNTLDDVILSEYNKYDETFSALLSEVKIKRIILPKNAESEFDFPLKETEVTFASVGDSFDFSGTKLEAVYESEGIYSYKITHGEKSILLPGNISAKAEKQLADIISPCNILKAPRHGNKNSCSKELLASLSPDAVVVSTGRKLSDDFSNRLSDYTVYSTKINGDIHYNFEKSEIIPYKKVK